MIPSFGFQPTGPGMTDEDFAVEMFDRPMSLAGTLGDQAVGGFLSTYSVGTKVRELSLPEPAPVAPGVVVEGDGRAPTFLPQTGRLPEPLPREYFERNAGSGMREERPEELEVRRQKAGAISEEAYKASPSFRPNVPWDRGMTAERAAALAEMQDRKAVRDFYGQKRPIASFFGNIAGQALDPINYIPVGGPLVRAAAIARAGRVAGTAGVASAEAAISTAIFGAATADARERLGDDVSWQAQVTDVAMGALIGAAFGGVVGGVGRAIELRTERRQADAALRVEAQMDSLRNVMRSRAALDDAAGTLARDGEVDLTATSGDFISQATAERLRLSRAWDDVRAAPRGDPMDPVVRISPDEIDGLLVARGGFRKVNELEISRSGYGLVKVMWQHGPESSEPPDLQIHKGDIMALPDVVRDFEPSRQADDAARQGREWRVELPAENGKKRTVVFADRRFQEDGNRHLITAYVQSPTEKGATEALSVRKAASPAASSSDVPSALGDTAEALSLRDTQGRPGLAGNVRVRPAGQDIAPASRSANAMPDLRKAAPLVSPEVQKAAKQADARLAKPEALKKQYDVDPESGAIPEDADIRQLEAEGRMTDEDRAEIEGADRTLETGKAFGEALKAAVTCII